MRRKLETEVAYLRNMYALLPENDRFKEFIGHSIDLVEFYTKHGNRRKAWKVIDKFYTM
jgi:hypothetical protein